MEEENPWVDTISIRHVYIKSVKPVYVEKTDKGKKKKEVSKETSKRDDIDSEKEKFGLININDVDRREEKISKFLDVLIDEFTSDMPPASKQWAIAHFGEEWLTVFLKDIQYLKEDLKSSNFFPSQDSMIFLKYIFLLKQAF